MKSIRNTACMLVLVGMTILGVMFGPRMADQMNSPAIVQAQTPNGIVLMNPNSKLPLMTFTATGQTAMRSVVGFGTASVELYGAATAATVQIKCSNDGGANYYGVSSTAGTATSGVLQYAAPAAFSYSGSPELFWMNLAGCTNIEAVSSGTFTGANVFVQITASSNKGII